MKELYWDASSIIPMQYHEGKKIVSENIECDKLNIFISLPFSGREDTIGSRYDKAFEWIDSFKKRNKIGEVNVVSQENIQEIIDKKKSVDDCDYPKFMGDDIRRVLECDVILMCEGWENSKGCNLEFQAAKIFGKHIFYEKN